MDNFLYRQIAEAVGTIPLPQPKPFNQFGERKDQVGRIQPFPLVYITSSGSKKSHFKIEPTSTNLPYHAEESGFAHGLPTKAPKAIGGEANWNRDVVTFQVQTEANIQAKVKSIESSFGSHTYVHKHVRVSSMKTHSFLNGPDHIQKVEAAVQHSWQHILENAVHQHMSGDCVVFGVVTAAYAGRLETLGVRFTEHNAKVIVDGSEGLTCRLATNLFEKKDIGSDGRKVLGVDMMCFLLKKNYHYPANPMILAPLPGEQPWFLSKGIYVTSWNTDRFQRLVQYCQNRDTKIKGWTVPVRRSFLLESGIITHIILADQESQLSPDARRRRYRNSTDAIGSSTVGSFTAADSDDDMTV